MKFLLPNELKKNYIGYPNTVAVVAVYDKNHVANFMSAAWQFQLSIEPMLQGVSISAKRYTNRLIRDSRRFSVAFYPFEAQAIYVLGGRLSGRDVDKVAKGGFEVQQGRAVDVPLIRGFYAAFECELQKTVTLGDHDLFVGMVKGIHMDEKVFSQDGITPLGVRPTLYLGGNRYLTVDKNTLQERTLENLESDSI